MNTNKPGFINLIKDFIKKIKSFIETHDAQTLVCFSLIALYFFPFIRSVSDHTALGFIGSKKFKVYARYSMFQAAIGVDRKVTDTSWGHKNNFGHYTEEYVFKIGAYMFILLLIPICMYFVHRLHEKRKTKDLLLVNMGLGIAYLGLYHYVVTRCDESYSISIIGCLVVVIILWHIIRNFLCYEDVKNKRLFKKKIGGK